MRIKFIKLKIVTFIDINQSIVGANSGQLRGFDDFKAHTKAIKFLFLLCLRVTDKMAIPN